MRKSNSGSSTKKVRRTKDQLYDHSFMIVVTGDAGVGKSALLKKFCSPERELEDMNLQATVGVDYIKSTLTVEERDIQLQSWDTAGQDRFRSITNSYYRSAMGSIICFDSCSEQSLLNLKGWVKDFREKAIEGAPILIVATKADLQE